VLYGIDNVINTELQFFSKTRGKIDTCMNYTRPSLAIEINTIKKAFVDAKNRGVKLLYLTEITSENISYCKELMSIVDELRHLEGIKGNFMLSESEYLSPVVFFEKEKVAPQIICSSLKVIIEQQQYIFDSFWDRSIPAYQRILEIESGIESEFIEVISDNKKAAEIYINLARSVEKEALLLFANSKAITRADRLGALDHDDNKYNNSVVVSVEDTGRGIDPEILPKLFSKFATSSESGTGLGLFISKNIIEAHGGKMWAANSNDGFGKMTRGARFCFTLPIMDSSTNRSIKTKSDIMSIQGISRT
jgi:signal transduction histidine kinase